MSSQTLANQIDIEEGMEIGFFHEPDNIKELLGGLPKDVEVAGNLLGKRLDVILAFIENRKTLEACLSLLKGSMSYDGYLWLAYENADDSDESDLDHEMVSNFAASLSLNEIDNADLHDNWLAIKCERK